MFVITADQVGSRSGSDAVAGALPAITARLGTSLVLPPERTAGDEFQLLLDDGAAVLWAVLALTRDAQWSVGCGIGGVRDPLPRSIREAAGGAFISARAAVDRAKRRSTRFAVSASDGDEVDDVGRDIEAIIDLLLILRARRTPEGWELFDLVTSGLSQAQAALALGISPQAASARAQAAGLKAEVAATGAIGKLLNELHRQVTGPAPQLASPAAAPRS